MTGASSAIATTRQSSDLVWDGGLHATAFADDAAPLLAGVDVGWTPDLLLATAVATDLMTLILRQATAAGIEPVAYISEQHIEAGSGRRGTIVVSPSVSVLSRQAADTLHAIITGASASIRSGCTTVDVLVVPRVSIASPSGFFRSPAN